MSGPRSCALDSVHILCSHLESGTSSVKRKTKTVLQSLLPVFSEVRYVCIFGTPHFHKIHIVM